MNLAPPGGAVIEKQVIGECGTRGMDPGAYVKYRTDLSPSAVRAFYEAELPKLGWHQRPNSSPNYFFGSIADALRADIRVDAFDSTPGVVSLYGTIEGAGPCPGD